MKKNFNIKSILNLNTTLALHSQLSFKALEVKAQKASAIADAIRARDSSRDEMKSKKRKESKRVPLIERHVNSVLRSIKRIYGEGYEVQIERNPKRSSCHSIIRVYNASLKSAAKVSMLKFAMYPSGVASRGLGSVAIYGEDASGIKSRIISRGNFFGFPIRSVCIEIGRRPFVDVTLAV